ncbi:MAG: hypothetical protein IT559_04780 [Alphaproteobacteria bacterium]|nr:hypothetical protein [Alphaproteobacteria bacterium]
MAITPANPSKIQNDDSAERDGLKAETLDLFNKAEAAIKKIEHEEGLDFPSVNQLRYVGRHLIDFLNNNDVEELRKAKRHCKRAIYDANDIGIQFYIEDIDLFKDDYKDVVIQDVLTKYLDYLDDRDAAEDFLEHGRQAGDDRDAFYEAAGEHYEKLKIAARDMERCREELNKKTNSIITSQKQVRMGTILTIIGLGLSAIGLISLFY